VPFFPSNHREEAYITAQKMSTTAQECGDVSLNPFKAQKEPQIIQTFPPGQRLGL